MFKKIKFKKYKIIDYLLLLSAILGVATAATFLITNTLNTNLLIASFVFSIIAILVFALNRIYDYIMDEKARREYLKLSKEQRAKIEKDLKDFFEKFDKDEDDVL